ncbi:MAG: class II aldolase/adducin family protein [Bacillota bacterium]
MEKAKEEVVNTARKIIQERLAFGTWGNISYRPVEDRVVITPSGIPYGELQYVDMVVVDLQGRVEDSRWKPSTELPLHLAVYRARHDIKAIVHVHSVYAAAFAIARQEIPVVLEEMAQVLGGKVPVAAYALPGSTDLGERAVNAFGDKGYAILLASHGLVAAGEQLGEALLRCRVVERNARILLYARLLGTPVLLEEKEITTLRDKYIHAYGQERNV